MAYADLGKRAAYQARYYRAHKPQAYAAARAAKRRLRLEVIAGYGGKCACCGESNEVFLALDHVNGDGAEHRRQGFRCDKLYGFVRREGFPATYQLLCHNCNFAKSLRGGCPHGSADGPDRKSNSN